MVEGSKENAHARVKLDPEESPVTLCMSADILFSCLIFSRHLIDNPHLFVHSSSDAK
jgi:hypothetical protein